jgi:hypothetical protein
MRADIHDGPELNSLQSEAGYIDARPHQPDRRNPLHRTAGPYIRVNRDRSLRAENRAMSGVPRKRRKVRALAHVTTGHGGSRRDPLQRPVMMVARCCRSIAWAALAFERGFPAITFDVHFQDGGRSYEGQRSFAAGRDRNARSRTQIFSRGWAPGGGQDESRQP